ncbi:MAG: diguanylate cyclase [Devosia sp.]|uniref:diguanylate cyclase domain-containing protein n=1 Tax=Devosia sp. TaxID=1871048 RepID=UPI0024CAA984|nr:diguanylate cyclase [Devosia sp.]UYN99255.1 MAG: diguanylate cyclase [Devosia sp.]
MSPSRPASTHSRTARPSRPALEQGRIFEASPVGLIVTDASGRIELSNPAAEAMLTDGKQSGGEHSLAALLKACDAYGLWLKCERLIRGEASQFRGEHLLQRGERGALWVQAEARRLDGDAAQLVLQLTDIDRLKTAEEALIYTEQRWNSALESARQGVWDYDQRKDRMFYSRMWRRLRGMDDDEEIGENHHSEWLSRIHPDDLEHLQSVERKQGQGEIGHDTLEYRERTRDGDYIWILSRGGPIEWGEDGEVLRSVGTDTDITALKTIEHALAAEKERLRVTLESIADGMISTDAEGRITFMNAAAESLTGLAATSAIGRPVAEVFCLRSERSGEAIDCPVDTCFRQQKPVRIDDDGVLIGWDGAQRDIRCTAAPVLTQDGTLEGAVLVFQDVTQSRDLQRQLTHSATHDALTGLSNRTAFEQALGRTIAAARSDREACLIYVDLDHFKPVNDSAGHAAGDALLRQIAKTIRETCRTHDTVARIGGDEFAVILEACPPEAGRRVAEAIVRAIGALVFSWAGRDYRVGASAGLTRIGGDPASPLGFVGEADAACYAAKAAGRGRVVAFMDMIDPT